MATATEEILNKLNKMEERQNALAEKLNQPVNTAKPPTKHMNYPPGANPEQVFGAPAIRSGEDVMTSRGFSYLKLAGAMSGVIPADRAKVELQVVGAMQKAFSDSGEFKASPGYRLAPLGVDYLPDDYRGTDIFREIKQMVIAGTRGADQDEIAWLRAKYYQAPGQKADPHSWIDQTIGGSLVPPPAQGELIELLRNRQALVAAGAQTVPLPPQGRITYPRVTKATQGYWVGENAPITGSQMGTGSLNLSAKKAAALSTVPNELIRFSSPAAEAILRSDMATTIGLVIDKGLLEGPGSDNVPLGLINTPGVQTIVPGTVAADGNTLHPEDFFSFLAAIEGANAQMTAWIMRPLAFYKTLTNRVDAVSANDKSGLFLFSPVRGLADGFQKSILGINCITSNQVSITRKKGAGLDLTYVIGGAFNDFIIGMWGAVEFSAATQGDTAFANDQTIIKSICHVDGGARHAAAFAVADYLKGLSA